MKTEKTYLDPTGTVVPARYVKKYDRLRDRVALAIAKNWLKAENNLRLLKSDSIAAIEMLQAAAAKDADVKPLGGKKGNVQFRSFDGAVTIRYDADAKTEFDERLAMAQQLISEAVREMSADAKNADLVEIATRAFQPRRTGRLDMQRVRDLCSYNVSHPKWKKAVEIIKACERQIGTRNYIRVSIRESRDSKPRHVLLDIAAL